MRIADLPWIGRIELIGVAAILRGGRRMGRLGPIGPIGPINGWGARENGGGLTSAATVLLTSQLIIFIIIWLFKHGFEKGASVRYGRFFWRKTGFLPHLKRCEYVS
jgi:hypothetical protein